METLQSHPGFYPRGRREGHSLISLLLQRVCHILPIKETPPRRLDGAVHITDGLLYGRADEGVALSADGGHCRDTQVKHQQAQIIQDLFRVHELSSGVDRTEPEFLIKRSVSSQHKPRPPPALHSDAQRRTKMHKGLL